MRETSTVYLRTKQQNMTSGLNCDLYTLNYVLLVQSRTMSLINGSSYHIPSPLVWTTPSSDREGVELG